MSTINYLRKKLFRSKIERNNPPPVNELIHPSFGITETDKKSGEKRTKFFIVFDVFKRK